MGKVILVCGKICSGKSYYSKSIKDKYNAVIISPDEATYELINNEQGEFYNEFSKKLNKYLTRIVGEIAKAGANVIFERGLWSHKERKETREYYKNNGIDCEIHYVNVDEETWNKNVEERNKRVLDGKGGSDFYLDEGLTPDEIIDIVLFKKDIYSTAVHFGPLICQPKSRCLNYNPLYEKDRFCVQIKWYSLNDDIIEFMNNEVINRVKNNERIDEFLND